jgi:hypothetical protein
VASLRRLRRVEAEAGCVDTIDCVKPFYPNFDIFIVLGPKRILVFCLRL